jgi:N-hydroxyarylamine O-acetyltransferase
VDLARYLSRLGVEPPPAPDAAALARLHEAHLLAVPFENLSIHWGEPIALDVPALFEKIVGRRRGGGCFELNLLFAWALRRLGFEVDLLSARVVRDGGGWGPELDHMCLRVRAGGEDFLADVGFGDSFVRPLALAEGRVHVERAHAYVLREEDGALELRRRAPGGDWQPAYRFTLAARRPEDFSAMAEFHRSSPESPFTRRRVCSVATREGRLTLTDSALVRTTVGGERTETPLPDAERWAQALAAHFGIEAPGTGR